MLQVVALVLPLFGLVLLGYVAGRLRRIPVEGLAWLNFFILYIALPALFFRLLATTPVEEFANWRFLFNASLGTMTIFALCFLLARWRGKGDVQSATVQGLAGAYGNIGYMGPPLALAAFGPEAGVPVALVFCVDNALHFTLAPTLMALGDKQRGPVLQLVLGIVRKIITHPFILATIVGMTAAWLQYRPPEAIDRLLANLAGAAAPCALFAMGVTAALRPLKRIPGELAWLIPVKLLLHPLLVYLLLFRLPGLEPVWLHSAVLLAALPAATNVFVIAQQYGVWEERASSMVVLSTLMSVVTVTTYLYLISSGLIP